MFGKSKKPQDPFAQALKEKQDKGDAPIGEFKEDLRSLRDRLRNLGEIKQEDKIAVFDEFKDGLNALLDKYYVSSDAYAGIRGMSRHPSISGRVLPGYGDVDKMLSENEEKLRFLTSLYGSIDDEVCKVLGADFLKHLGRDENHKGFWMSDR